MKPKKYKKFYKCRHCAEFLTEKEYLKKNQNSKCHYPPCPGKYWDYTPRWESDNT